jgi:hypothetical protein
MMLLDEYDDNKWRVYQKRMHVRSRTKVWRSMDVGVSYTSRHLLKVGTRTCAERCCPGRTLLASERTSSGPLTPFLSKIHIFEFQQALLTAYVTARVALSTTGHPSASDSNMESVEPLNQATDSRPARNANDHGVDPVQSHGALLYGRQQRQVTSHTPSGISRGDLKAVAAIEVCQARDKCRIKKVECHSGDTRGRCHIVSARAAEMDSYAPLAQTPVRCNSWLMEVR